MAALNLRSRTGIYRPLSKRIVNNNIEIPFISKAQHLSPDLVICGVQSTVWKPFFFQLFPNVPKLGRAGKRRKL
jgi:hypothetical protein